MSIFTEGILGTGISSGTVGPGSSFFNFIKEEASNALGIGQDLGLPGKPQTVSMRSGFRTDPRTGAQEELPRTIVVQQPDARVFIKRKEFSSFRDNFSGALLGKREQQYSRTLKRLLAGKVEQLAQYEALTKFVKGIKKDNGINNIFNNILTDLFRTSTDQDLFEGMLFLSGEEDRIQQAATSQWIIEEDDPNNRILGKGTGVIELANVSSVTTNLNLTIGDEGSVNITMEDPFNLMLITPAEIEAAVKQEILAGNSNLTDGVSEADQLLKEYDDATLELNRLVRDTAVRRSQFIIPQNETERIGSFFEFFITTQEELPNLTGAEFRTPVTSETEGATNFQGDLGSDSLILVIDRLSGDITSSLSEDQPVGELLTEDEKPLFDKVVEKFRAYKGKVSGVKKSLSNDNIDDIREDLLKKFAGRSIISPMDAVYVYISSNNTIDDDSAALENDLVSDEEIRSRYRLLISKEDGKFNSLTEDKYIAMVRQGLLKANRDGSFVFVGLIKDINRSYSEGKHIISLSGTNNMRWLSFSKINTQPGLRQPQGALNFPLTPFDVDEETNRVVLSSENQNILPAAIKEKIQTELEDTTDSIRTIPNYEGIIFKWKRGIFSTTANIAFRSSVDAEPRSLANSANFRVGLHVNTTPFANLDAADIMSLLITGTPYNFSNFLKNATRAGIYSVGPTVGNTYAQSIQSIERAFNKVNGQFDPLVTINVRPDEQLLSDLTTNNFVTTEADQTILKLKNKLQEFIDLQDRADKIKGRTKAKQVGSFTDDNKDIAINTRLGINEKISSLRNQLGILTEFQQLKTTERRLAYVDALKEARSRKILGNIPKGLETSEGFNLASVRLQGFLFQLQFKSLQDVMFNRDKNYLVISNEYEEDLDIQAFARFLKSEPPDLWNSEYEAPIQICKNVANTLDFEFYCDASGNIHFRPPQYNKTPLSILRKLAEEDEAKFLFPRSMIHLLQRRKESITDELTIVSKEQTKIENREGRFKNFTDQQIEESETISSTRTNKLITEFVRARDTLRKTKDLTVSKLISQTSGVLFDKFVEVDERVTQKLKPFQAEAQNQRFDDIGIGSHKRFVVKDDVIKQFTFREEAPPYTRVDVKGQYDLVDPTSIDSLHIWAGAVDYDLWREFGYIPYETTKPFFRNALNQCLPYAQFLISRARKQIINGTVTLAGNEYYQLGDVIFFEPYGLLFYVIGVGQSLTFGGEYVTTLTLTYGRAPGEFIPTPLDIIGKTILNSGKGTNNIASSQSDVNRRTDFTGDSLTKKLAVSDRREKVIESIQIDTIGEEIQINKSRENFNKLKRALIVAKGLKNRVTLSPTTQQPVVSKVILRAMSDPKLTAPSADSAKKAVILLSWFNEPFDITLDSKPKLNEKGFDDNIDIEIFDKDIHGISNETILSSGNDTNKFKNFVEIRIASEPVGLNQIQLLNKNLTDSIDKFTGNTF